MARKKKNRLFENLEITGAGAKGKSIAKAPDGKVIFIKNAVPGDIADIQTTRKKKSFYEGTAVNIHKFSDKRVEPVCPHFGTCGGCKWQFMGYEHQLFYKQQEVENNLKRIGKIELPEITPISGSENIYFYRNKMEFSFSDSRWLTLQEIQSDTEFENKNALGFHIPGMWDKILDIKECFLQEDPSNAIRNFIKAFATKNEMAFFNPREQSGFLRTLMIRTS
ncbi:MAG: TRAM domain-containing protein, partial [Gillisia sp.]